MNLTLRNVEDRLQNIGKARIRDHGTHQDGLISLQFLRNDSVEMQRSDTVKEEGTAGCELDGKEVDGKGEEVYKAERNISPLESEAVKPTELTPPDPVTTETDVVPVVHSGIRCDVCGVCTSLR